VGSQFLQHRPVLSHVSLESENTNQGAGVTSHARQAGVARGGRSR
jgi:hypothetical protein